MGRRATAAAEGDRSEGVKRPMTTTRARTTIAAIVVALVAAACSSGAPGASPSTSAAATNPPPSASGSGSAAPSAPSSAEPTSAPTASAAPRSGTWSEPQRVGDVRCEDLAVVLDAATGYHVVAECEDGLQYLTSRSGEEWSAEPVPAPEEGNARGPEVAVDDGWLYVGYTRVRFTGDTCSPDPYEKLGVEVRSRRLSDGAWAEPMPVGTAGDELQSLRVVDTVISATVAPGDGSEPAFVQRVEGPSARVGIPDAVETSLRIGDDGRPRIAYSTGDAIHLGTVDGDALTSSLVADAEGSEAAEPALVLAPGDAASLVWTQTSGGEDGCGGPGDADGTYFATDAGGSWDVTRISELTGETSLTLDSARGEAHALVATGDELHHFVRDGAGSWSSSVLSGGGTDPVIRVDPATDALVAFAIADGEIRMFTQE
jgi:hypothetical protein